MSSYQTQFNQRAVNPTACLQYGWNLVKDQYWLFLGIILVGILIGSFVPFGILMGPMLCGIHLTLLYRMRGGVVSFELLFKGFDYFLQSLIVTLVQVVPALVLMGGTYLVFVIRMVSLVQQQDHRHGGSPDVVFQQFFATFIFIILVICVVMSAINLLFFFTFQLIVDRGLSGMDAIKLSAKAAMANLGGLIVLMILTGAMALVGVLACYIGAIFVLPIIFAAHAVAYRQVFPEINYQPYPTYPTYPNYPNYPPS